MFFGREKSDFNVIHISAIMMPKNDPELITRHKKKCLPNSRWLFFLRLAPSLAFFKKKSLQRQRATRHISFSLLHSLPSRPWWWNRYEHKRARSLTIALLLLSCCLSKSEEILVCFYFLRFDLICPSLFVWRWVNPVSDDNFICSLPTKKKENSLFSSSSSSCVCVYV